MLLLEHGADIYALNGAAFYNAMKQCSASTIKILLDHDKQHRFTAIWEQARNENALAYRIVIGSQEDEGDSKASGEEHGSSLAAMLKRRMCTPREAEPVKQ